MNKFFVTGASGYIGLHLVKTLVSHGHEVTCLARRTSSVGRLRAWGATVRYGDLSDPHSLREAVRDGQPDCVFHLAGITKAARRQQFIDVNQFGTRRLLSVLAELPAAPVTVVVSSLAAAGPSHGGAPKRETDPAQPVSVYGASKLAAEQVSMEFAARLPLTIVRPPIVLGPGDREGLEMYRSVARFGLHLAPGRDEMFLSWIHVQDLVDAMVEAAWRGRRLQAKAPAQGIYFATAPDAFEYGGLGNLLAEALGRPSVRILRNPAWRVWLLAGVNELGSRVRGRPHIFGLDKAREAMAGSWICAGDKLRRETEFRPRNTLSRTLLEAVNWYREHGWL